MALFSRLHALRRSRVLKLMVGGSAVGVGAAAGIAAGSTGTEAPDAVPLGDSGTTVDLEGQGVDVQGGDSLQDSLDSPSDSPTDFPSDSPTDSPTDSPMDSPGDSPDDSPDNSGPSASSGPGSGDDGEDNSGPGENSGPGSGDDDDSGSG
jgi:hypothetical protein